MRFIKRTLFSLILASPLVGAVFKDEVGHTDFVHSLIGVPQPHTTFFHRPRRAEPASLLYTLSDVGVLGAINPGSGTIVWRQTVSKNITNGGGFLRAGEDQDWVVSAYGPGVQAWSALTGRNVWWTQFEGAVKDLEVMELAENGQKDVLVLFAEEEGMVLRRLDSLSGKVSWEFRDAGKDVPLQVSTNAQSIFLVSLHGSPTSYTLKVSVLDTFTGKRTDEILISTKGDVESEDEVMFVGANSAAPIVAWADKTRSTLKVNVLGTKTKYDFPLPADTLSIDIHAPHLVQSDPHFLVHIRTPAGNRAEVYHVGLKDSKIAKAYDLPHLPGLGAFSTSSDGSNVYFTRMTEEEVIMTSSVSHGVLARWPFKPGNDVEPMHAVAEVVKKADGSFAVRSAATTKADDWIMVRGGEVGWTRHEGMAGGIAATYAEIPESEELAKVLEQESHTNAISSFVHRLQRHTNHLQYLPDFMAGIPTMLLNNLLGVEKAASEGLVRDSFGFNKIAILLTRRGRLYGLDVGNGGKVLWSTDAFGLKEGQTFAYRGMWAEEKNPYVTVRGAAGDYAVVKVDTGAIIETMPPGSWPPVQSTAVVDSESGKYLLPIGIGGKIGEIPLAWMPKETVVVRGSEGDVRGVVFSAVDGKATDSVSWTFTPPVGQEIITIATRQPQDPVASIGRVLGDRRVNYKYLNLNTLVVATVNTAMSSMSTYLIDEISGQILASATHEGVDPRKPISCVIAENFFACSFYGEYKLTDGSNQSLKGYQVVVSDMYESPKPDDRGPLGDSANFSSLNPVDLPTGPALPTIVAQTFILSTPLTSLTVTKTRQGISSRQILAYLPEGKSIAALSRQILEPRRPVGRDPVPAEIEAEGLIKYLPGIEMDPKAMISHERELIGIEHIMTAPATVESTSLVFAFGIDVFGTRVAPSQTFDILGKGFNKISMVGTVVALFGGVLVLGPIVRKKQIDMRWQAQA